MAAVETAAKGDDTGHGVTPGDLVIVGGGEHARVVADAAEAAGYRLRGYTDASPSADAVGPWLGTDAELATRRAAHVEDRVPLVLGFGGPQAARRLAVAALGEDQAWAVVIHPAAWVSPRAVVGPGTVVLAGAIVNAGARVGPHVIVNTRAVVEHDVVVGAHAHLAPSATVGGAARIGEGAFVGLGAAVRDHVDVGAGAVVGMGAVVVADVPGGSVVMGVPARVRRPRG